MNSLQHRFGTRKPTGVGGDGDCGCSIGQNPYADYTQKCGMQRIPVNIVIPAPTVNPTNGEVTASGTILFTPKHDGVMFDPATFRVLSATFLDGAGALQSDYAEAFVRNTKISKDHVDCLGSDEELGLHISTYSQPECCDGVPVCWPPFQNDKNGKDTLSIEFINRHVVQTGSDPNVFAGREITVRGYIRGKCTGAGYQKNCDPSDSRNAI